MLDFLAQAEVLGLWQLDMPHLLKPMGGLLLSESRGRRVNWEGVDGRE